MKKSKLKKFTQCSKKFFFIICPYDKFEDSGLEYINKPINLDHVITFEKEYNNTMLINNKPGCVIRFNTATGHAIYWYYPSEKARDKNYDLLIKESSQTIGNTK